MPTTDVLIVGAGPGGYVAAIRAAQRGKKVIVVDKHYVGGVCLNVGCIPSKALITAAKRFRQLPELEEIGIHAGPTKVDWKKVVQWRGSVVDKLTKGVSGLLKGNGVQVLEGAARLTGPHDAIIETADGEQSVNFEQCIVATGSRPIEVPGFSLDGQRVITSTEALVLPSIPSRLVIIGAGVIGLELGCMYANFGSQVTVLEMLDQVLPGTDREIAKAMARILKKRGIDVHLGVRAQSASVKAKAVSVSYDEAGASKTVEADVCLVAVGRRANVAGIGLDAAGVAVGEQGFIEVDQQCRTNVSNIYAIGDVTGPPQLAHKASKQGIVAADHIAGRATSRDFAAVPGVIFTDPEVATAGLTEEEAIAAGRQVRVGRFPFAANGRAMTTLETAGFVKVVADAATDLVLGVHIIGPEASDLISEAALALEMGATVEELAATVHPHPTLGEVMMEAAEDVHGMSAHVLKKRS